MYFEKIKGQNFAKKYLKEALNNPSEKNLIYPE